MLVANIRVLKIQGWGWFSTVMIFFYNLLLIINRKKSVISKRQIMPHLNRENMCRFTYF